MGNEGKNDERRGVISLASLLRFDVKAFLYPMWNIEFVEGNINKMSWRMKIAIRNLGCVEAGMSGGGMGGERRRGREMHECRRVFRRCEMA